MLPEGKKKRTKGERKRRKGEEEERKEGKKRERGGKEENKEGERRKMINTGDTLCQVLGVTRLSRLPSTFCLMSYTSNLMPYVLRGKQVFTRHVRANEN